MPVTSTHVSRLRSPGGPPERRVGEGGCRSQDIVQIWRGAMGDLEGSLAIRNLSKHSPRLHELISPQRLPSTKRGGGSGSSWSTMGNFKSKASSNPRVTKIMDGVWDRFTSTSEHQALGVQDLYCAVLLVYNDINKTLPGPYNDPPSKEEVEELLKTNDRNDDGMLDRDEFNAFIETFTKKVTARVSTNILLFSFVIPTIVTLSRPRVEQLPGIGPIVKKAPPPIYSAVMTTLIVFVGSQFKRN